MSSQTAMIKRVEMLYGDRATSCVISFNGKDVRERKFIATVRDITCSGDSLEDALGGLIAKLERKLTEDKVKAEALAASIAERLAGKAA